MVSTGLTVPVAVTARVTAPVVTGAVVYRTGVSAAASHQTRPTAASTASDNRPATSQIFRGLGDAGAGAGDFGTSTTGATGSTRAFSIPTGMLMLRTPPPCPASGTITERRGAALIRVKGPESSKEWARTAQRGATRGPKPYGSSSVSQYR